MSDLGERTIRDFGEQWQQWGQNEGYYGSLELLQDILGPLLRTGDLAGLHTADIGAGTGRVSRMLLDAGVASVVALEPSAGVERLRDNLADEGERVRVIHGPGDALPAGLDLDLAISIGVVQFIPDPEPVLRAIWQALRPGGSLVLWVYAREGLGPYLALNTTLRAVATRLPHGALVGLSSLIALLLDGSTLR